MSWLSLLGVKPSKPDHVLDLVAGCLGSLVTGSQAIQTDHILALVAGVKPSKPDHVSALVAPLPPMSPPFLALVAPVGRV